MKRWEITTERFDKPLLIYATTIEKAKQWCKNDGIINIEEWLNREYLISIENIINQCETIGTQPRADNMVREWYKTTLPDGKLIIRFVKDLTDGLYLDTAQYQFMSNDCRVYPITFSCSTPKEVEKLFFFSPLSCEIPIVRFYGQPKMQKPTELKGIKQAFSADFMSKKCACQCFLKDGDLWIKHRDFFSASHKPDPEDIGTPLSYRYKKYFGGRKNESFIYPDTWGDIVLRNEAWIVFRGFENCVKRDRHPPVTSMVKAFLQSKEMRRNYITEVSNEWERFFENICKEYVKYLDKEKTN